MRRLIAVSSLVFLTVASGCASRGGSAAGGAVGGAAVGAGAYEFKAHQEMQRIEDELKAGKMTQQEYDIRKDQIHRMSLIQ